MSNIPDTMQETPAAQLVDLTEAGTNELLNQLVIDGTTYNINAVKSDVAGKTEKSLEIKAYNINNIKGANGEYSNYKTPQRYDGSEDTSIHIVDAISGGGFGGPITVPSIEDIVNPVSPYRYFNHVVNYQDLLRIIEDKVGTGYFTWGNHTFSWGDHTFSENLAGGQPQRMGTVLGKRPDLPGFAENNYFKKYLPFYIYLCTDTLELFYGTSKDKEFKQVAKDALTADLAVLAQRSNKAIKLSSEYGNADDYYTYETLAAELENIKSLINGLGAGLGENEDNLVLALNVTKALFEHTLTLNELGGGGHSKPSWDTLNDFVDDFDSSTVLTVKKAEEADHAVEADEAAIANRAIYDDATWTPEPRQIQAHYYHISNNSDIGWNDPTVEGDNNSKTIIPNEKLIIISSEAPTPGSGHVGDLWIKY